jgi:hypothetical protein
MWQILPTNLKGCDWWSKVTNLIMTESFGQQLGASLSIC